MSDLTERLRQQIAYDEWNVGANEESVARDALARITELEAELAVEKRAHLYSASSDNRINTDADLDYARQWARETLTKEHDHA